MLVGARAEAVGDLVLLQESGEALDFALIGGGEEDAGVLLHQGVEGVDQRGDGAVEALGGAGGEVDFGEVAAVGVEDVYGPSWSRSQPVKRRRRSSRSQGER